MRKGLSISDVMIEDFKSYGQKSIKAFVSQEKKLMIKHHLQTIPRKSSPQSFLIQKFSKFKFHSNFKVSFHRNH